MDHTEYIVEIKKVIDPWFIKKIISFIDYKATKNLSVKGGLDTNIRNVKGYSLNLDTPTNNFYWNFIKAEINRLYVFYKAKFPLMMSEKINQIDILKYSPGGKYEIHTDHYTTNPRHLSIIMNLNDDYEGGDLIFTDQQKNEIKKFNLGKGSIIFFPSNFIYPHGITPIKKGTRYSIVAWLQ